MDINISSEASSLLKFLMGTIGLGLLGHFGNSEIQQTKLAMERQVLEDKYIQQFIATYGTHSAEDQIEYVNMLVHLTKDEDRKSRFDSLRTYLVTTKETAETKRDSLQSKIKEISVTLGQSKQDIKKTEAENSELQKKLARTLSASEKDQLKKEIEEKNEEIEALRDSTLSMAMVIDEAQSKKKNLTAKIDGTDMDTETTEVTERAFDAKYIDIKKGETMTISDFNLEIKAEKVNSIFKSADLRITIDTLSHKPLFSLNPGQFCIIRNKDRAYKILLNTTYNDQNKYGHSRAKVEIREIKM